MKAPLLFLLILGGIFFQCCSLKTAFTGSGSDSNELSCDRLISTSYDRVTATSKSGTTSPMIVSQDRGKTGYILDLYLIKRTLIFSIHVSGVGDCIDEDDQIFITFRDGSTLEMANNGDFNCDSDFALYFGNIHTKFAELEEFSTKDISKMRISTEENSIEKSFTDRQSAQLRKSFECLRDQL